MLAVGLILQGMPKLLASFPSAFFQPLLLEGLMIYESPGENLE